jgi:hypothetical protein
MENMKLKDQVSALAGKATFTSKQLDEGRIAHSESIVK